jgi:hypothetical protein
MLGFHLENPPAFDPQMFQKSQVITSNLNTTKLWDLRLRTVNFRAYIRRMLMDNPGRILDKKKLTSKKN